MSAAVNPRYGLDDLRRLATAMGRAVGLMPERSSELAAHLLWFDAAGAAPMGIATLPEWLEEIEGGRIDPKAAGRVVSEHTAMAVLDGENGLPPLILGRAAAIAVEKAREAAMGMVRVVGIGALATAAPVVAGIATGPMAGGVLGPGRYWGMALPSQGGLPVLFDSGLAAPEADRPAQAGRRGPSASKSSATGRERPPMAPTLLEDFWLGAEVLVPDGGWLVAALTIPAIESFAAFDERLADAATRMTTAPGRLLPEPWEARRLEARRSGIPLDAGARKALEHWARRLSVAFPDPMDDRHP